MANVLRPVLFAVAVIYFAVDELFAAVTRPVAAWLARQRLLERVRSWIRSLRPYPALTLFLIPLIILEPVKPVAAYLTATGHFAAGAALFASGELLKLVLVERLFQLNKAKLLSIPAFAWCYIRARTIQDWLESSAAWRNARRAVSRAGLLIREVFGRIAASQRERGAGRALARAYWADPVERSRHQR